VTDFVDIEPSAPGDPDWSVLEFEGVIETARKAAYKASEEVGGAYEVEDAEQDAMILLATRRDLRECVLREDLGLGVLHHRLYLDLLDKGRVILGRAARNTSYEAAREGRE
jgi:hypothetical protein